jgi:hypothetical protein
VRYRKWQIVDHSTHTLSFLNQAAELNLVTVTMTEGSEENAQMQESHEITASRQPGGFFISAADTDLP